MTYNLYRGVRIRIPIEGTIDREWLRQRYEDLYYEHGSEAKAKEALFSELLRRGTPRSPRTIHDLLYKDGGLGEERKRRMRAWRRARLQSRRST